MFKRIKCSLLISNLRPICRGNSIESTEYLQVNSILYSQIQKSNFSITNWCGSQINKDDKEKIISQKSDPGVSSNEGKTDAEQSDSKIIPKINIKLLSKMIRKKIDYSQSYTANNFVTTSRACNEYLLKPTDLTSLKQHQRRNPFDEYGEHENINVYLKRDVEAKAIKIWGSLEAIAKEKEKQRKEYEMYRQQVFNMKKTLRDYQNKIDNLENPFNENRYSNTKIQNTFSGKVVLSAIAINGTNFIVKLIGYIYTGSSSLFAESIHSLADTMNQLILAFGLNQSLKQPNPEHPYGYSNMTYITSLISGVGIFCFGTGISWYHGITGLMYPHEVVDMSWALLLLLGSAVSEGATLLMAYLDTRQNADKLGLKFWDYVIQGYKPSVNVVLLEDIAAILGVGIAASCMTYTHFTGSLIADSIGSLLIGGVMGGVASFIIYTNTTALVGRSIPSKRINAIRNDLESDIMVRSIHDVKATDMGGQTVMFKAEADIDGREITRSYLEKIDIEKLAEEMANVSSVEAAELFMLKHGENIVDRVGAEIDRIERNLRKKYPDLQHVDLEVL